MNKNTLSLRPSLILTSLALALPVCAEASAYFSSTLGSGPDGYHSTEVRSDADLFDTPLSVNVLGFKSDSSASDTISQSDFGLKWKISDLATLGATHNTQDNSLINISGNAINLALTLDTLWHGTLQTRLDLKRAVSAYHFNDLPPKAAAYETINQTGNSIGLTQDITDWLSINAGRDQYSYDNDPYDLAIYLMRTFPHKFKNTSSNLLSLPDSTNHVGLNWRPLETLSIDISSSMTTTQLNQDLDTKLLGIDYQVTKHLNIYATVSKVTSTAVVTKKKILPNLPKYSIPVGTTVIPATEDTYTEFSLGWTF
jgi:hypothetical protein